MASDVENAVTELEGTLEPMTTVVVGITALVDKFANDAIANKDEPAKIVAIATAYKAHAASLAAKIAEHTAAEDEPVPPSPRR